MIPFKIFPHTAGLLATLPGAVCCGSILPPLAWQADIPATLPDV